ncbi:BDM_1a_G0025830.mRNA.1.CDS.1 [Saccharomyces cerevisiae]|nr:BDM_1a_G0025830.mRNA.1.CDS.1 [Saccharomyces cerevisiae]CAI7166859.1 BDM_1a_G0025830.mRNA.1.CDS.1 [Saccharomyces cerevisiae]
MKFSFALITAFFSAVALARSITTTITATKNGQVYTKTITQEATFVWQGEGSSGEPTSSSESSSKLSSTETASDASSTNGGSGNSITTTITATKNGHVYTKTIIQDATFVWQGEGSNAKSTSSSESSSEPGSTKAPSSTRNGSGKSTTKTITATKNGQVYTKTVTQDATFIWGGSNSINGTLSHNSTNTTGSNSTSNNTYTRSNNSNSTTHRVNSSSSRRHTSSIESSSSDGAGTFTIDGGMVGAAVAAVLLL